RAVTAAQPAPGAARRLATEPAGPVQEEPAGVDAHDFAPSADERDEVPDDDTRAAADLEHVIPRPDGDEPQEAPPQPGLRRCPAARLETRRHLLEVRLSIGVAPRIEVTVGRARVAPRRHGRAAES